MQINRQWHLKERPVGMVGLEHFEYVESPIPEPDFDRGQVLVRNLLLSFEPAMRGWMDDEPSYMPPADLGEPMRAFGIGQVIESANPLLPQGALVQGPLNWQEYSIGDPASPFGFSLLPDGVSPELVLSVLGGNGLTAYYGLLGVGRPQQGETVLVSGAAGATGSLVAQIARLKGCRVIGIAGGPEKCEWLKQDCRIDEVIDYKNEELPQRLAELCPEGVDLYFDNVGGATLEAAIDNMVDNGRIVLCGVISGYNDESPPGPHNMFTLVKRRINMQGFIASDCENMEEVFGDLAKWVSAGEIAWRADIQEGFDNIPATLLRLFSGRNNGKQLLKLADPE